MDFHSSGSFCIILKVERTWLDHTTYFLQGDPLQNQSGTGNANMQLKRRSQTCQTIIQRHTDCCKNKKNPACKMIYLGNREEFFFLFFNGEHQWIYVLCFSYICCCGTQKCSFLLCETGIRQKKKTRENTVL